RKGDHTSERPHRLSHILEIPPSIDIVSQQLLQMLAAKVAETVADAAKNGSVPPRAFNLEEWIQRHDLKVRRGPLPWNGRGEKWELDRCPFNADHTGGCAVITRGYDGKLGFKCQHNSCAGKGWRELRDFLEPNWKGKAGASTPLLTERGVMADWAEPIPFKERVVTPLPPDVLPGFLGDMATAVARATETPLELAALLGIGIVSAAASRKVVLSPEPGYIEPLNIYTAVAMESGNRKTAVLNRMTVPLADWELSEARRLEPEVKRVASERKTQEARIKWL